MADLSGKRHAYSWMKWKSFGKICNKKGGSFFKRQTQGVKGTEDTECERVGVLFLEILPHIEIGEFALKKVRKPNKIVLKNE